MRTDNDYNFKLNSIAGEYEKLKQDRHPYLEKAKVAAKYTIPSILADDTTINSRTGQFVKQLHQPNQSVGADGVNNLATKVTLTMLPPNQTCFKFSLESMKNPNVNENYKNDVNRGLALIEQKLLEYQESLGDRVCLGEALKHLYITGNVFLVHDPEDGLRYYPLNRYVVKRDYQGNVLKAITEERIGFAALPADIQETIVNRYLEGEMQDKADKETRLEEQEFVLYTVFKREKRTWTVHQEIEGIKLPKSEGKYPIDICPFMALRYTRIDGESYGRGLIEEYIGDISYHDTLSLAIKQASLAASKLVMLVNPNGLTKIKALAETKNGGYALGREEDVRPLQCNKAADLQVAQAVAETIERRLNRVFVMKAAVQRDAERVTAEEIRQMVADLEESQGNHYSILCKEFQLAYTKITYHHLKKLRKNELPDLVGDKNVKLTVTAGLESLNRTSELNKWNTFFEVMGKFVQIADTIGCKRERIAEMVATSLNLDLEGMLYTEEEQAQMQQQAQEQQLMNRVAPNLVNKYSDMQMKQQEMEQQQEG